jgi:hypothetical protein
MRNKISVRVATQDDAPDIKKLCLRNGLLGEVSEVSWNWLWVINPAMPKGWSPGWVLSCDEQIVGYIGNVPRRYVYMGEELTAGAARSFVIDPKYRKFSLKLVANFFLENQADFLLFANVNDYARPTYEIAGAKVIPQEDPGRSIIWVLSGARFTLAALSKAGLKVRLLSKLNPLFDLIFQIEKAVKGRIFLKLPKGIRYVTPHQLPIEFDEFWSSLSNKQSSELVLCRDRSTLEWQLNGPCENLRGSILVCSFDDHQKLLGYATLARWDALEGNLTRLMVIDVITLNEDKTILSDLITGAYLYSTKQSVDLLQLNSMPSKIFREIKPRYSFALKSNVSWLYFTENKRLGESFENRGVWNLTMNDGDSAL